jgi:hypothetical protein
MPRISTFLGIAIRMFHDDHGYSHFHAQHADGHANGHAKIRIDTLEPIESNLPRRQLRFVLAWAELIKRPRPRHSLRAGQDRRLAAARRTSVSVTIW